MILAKTLMEKLPETCSKCQLFESVCKYDHCMYFDGLGTYCTSAVRGENCREKGYCLVSDCEHRINANSKPENCPLVEFDETKIDDRYRYVGDDTILDTKINEKLHPCPYEGCEGACPYYVYFDEYGFYCYESECCAMEEGK